MTAESDIRSGPEWVRAKERAKLRDQYRCQHCDRRDGKMGADLQVHHIRPVKKGGSNDLNNLATLCNDCHWTLHSHYDGRERLTVDLLEEDRPSWSRKDERVPLERLGGPEDEIVALLKSEGPTQLKDIIDEIGYSRGYVTKCINNLKFGGYVCRISRGVYAYITENRYRDMIAREKDEYGRVRVDVWDPGNQITLDEVSGDA